MLSVVVPAYNEEKLLGGTLLALRDGLAGAGYGARDYELWVTDNASTDATARIAREAGARVVLEPRRQIARARNVGAAHARGGWLLFVDADTHPGAGLLAIARDAMADGRWCGGGAVVDGTGASPGVRLTIGCWNAISRSARLACGAFLFCRAEAFRDLGGFSEELYAAEEVDLSWRLRRWGRSRRQGFRIIHEAPLRTSLRKVDLYSPGEIWAMVGRALLSPRRALRDRGFLAPWYDGRR